MKTCNLLHNFALAAAPQGLDPATSSFVEPKPSLGKEERQVEARKRD